MHHEHLDHPHCLLDTRPALGVGDVEGVANNLEIFVEVRLGKERTRCRDGTVDLSSYLYLISAIFYYMNTLLCLGVKFRYFNNLDCSEKDW